jgi:hypothetical protein
MLRCDIAVASGADQLLYEGLPMLMPVLDELDRGAVLIGGLATMAWLRDSDVGMPIRATRDVDLGMDRAALGLRGDRARVAALLEANGFAQGYLEEAFRFARTLPGGDFVVDLLVAPGASRRDPPILEPGIPTLAAPGLAYALQRGPLELELRLLGEQRRSFRLQTVHLDAAFVLKATLVASGVRTRADRRVTDTVDAIMLAAACSRDTNAMGQLASSRSRTDVKKALRWVAEQFSSAQSNTARRVAAHFDDDAAGDWAVEVARVFTTALEK